MKKLLMVLALAAFTTSAFAAPCKLNGSTAVFCQYDSGCWTLNDTDADKKPVEGGCDTQAKYCDALFQGGGEVNGGSCTGTPLTYSEDMSWSTGQVIYCDWGPPDTECWAKDFDDPCTGGFRCTQPDCSDSPRKTGGVKYCDYGEANQYGDGGCWAITNAEDQTNCDADGEEVSVCPCGAPGTYPCSSPIVRLPSQATSNILTAMHNAVNLQVTGAATLSIYDIKGKVVRTQNIGQSGVFNVQLQLPRGLYVVQATSGSWKQTVKVTVK
jgi:hypothetical protein